MNRLHQTIVLFCVIAVPAAAQSYFAAPGKPCFTSGSATYQVASDALIPDYRIRIASSPAGSDLRIQLVDRVDEADFVIADDFDSTRGDVCKAASAIKTIRADAEETSPDVVVALAREIEEPDYKIYVHSARYSHQDAAALLAAMWKAQKRKLADNR